jgi:hypothetical protein
MAIFGRSYFLPDLWRFKHIRCTITLTRSVNLIPISIDWSRLRFVGRCTKRIRTADVKRTRLAKGVDGAMDQLFRRGRFLPGAKSERLPCGLCLARFIAGAAGRNLAGLETGTVSGKLLKINIRLSRTIGSHEGLRNSSGSKRILPGGNDASRSGRYLHPGLRGTGTL